MMADTKSDEEVETARKVLEAHMSLKEDQTFSDVVIVVEGTEFPCHRSHLSAVSDYFKTALTIDMREAHERRIELPDIGKEVFSTLLTSIYGGKYVLTEENLFDIWAAADRLQISFISAQCKALCKKMLDKMSTKNCLDYLCKVRLLDQEAHSRVLKFICEHFSNSLDITIDPNVLTQEEMKSLVAMKELSVFTEDDVIEFVLNWALSNQDSIRSDREQDDSTDSLCCLADILECTRYLLISGGCLHGTLASHPLVKAKQRCQDFIQKISRYQIQPRLQQTWCPPAAIQREHSDTTNVLLLYSNGQFSALNLKNMTWGRLEIPELDIGIHDIRIVFYNTKLYVFSGDNISWISLGTNNWCTTRCSIKGGLASFFHDSIILYKYSDIVKSTVVRYKLGKLPPTFSTDKCQHRYLGSIGTGKIDGMCINAVTHIGSTDIVFCGKDDVDSYTILVTSLACGRFITYPNQLGSASRLVTIRSENEVFVLQENGCLWRIQLSDKIPYIKITHELVLWDGEISLIGAVLYNHQLMIVGDFKHQAELSETIDRSMADVFQSVVKIKPCRTWDVDCSDVTLALVPKSLLS